jgi:hypothetical protein
MEIVKAEGLLDFQVKSAFGDAHQGPIFPEEVITISPLIEIREDEGDRPAGKGA